MRRLPVSGVFEGLDKLEIGRSVRSAPELEQRFNTPGGNVYHVSATAMRFGPLRPAVGLGGYKMPIEGLWLTGAGTHPTGGISGIPGYVAAKTLLKYVTGLTAVQAATINLEQFPTSLDAVQLNRVSELMQEAGLIHGSFQASSLING